MAKPWYRWPKNLRQQILTRDNHTCRINLPGCTTTAQAIDHIIPVSKGGAWFDPNNLRAACKHCNQKRKTNRAPTPTHTPPEHW